jgi:hypothetical protein
MGQGIIESFRLYRKPEAIANPKTAAQGFITQNGTPR